MEWGIESKILRRVMQVLFLDSASDYEVDGLRFYLPRDGWFGKS